MQTDLHPELKPTTYRCTCGAPPRVALSTEGGEVRLQICSRCHPFFTGKERIVDTAGRIDKFRRRYQR